MSPGHSEEGELGSLVRFPLGFSLGRPTSFIGSAGIYEHLPGVQHLLADRQSGLLGSVSWEMCWGWWGMPQGPWGRQSRCTKKDEGERTWKLILS